MSPQKEKSARKRAPKTTLDVPTPSLRRGRSASVDVKPIPMKSSAVSPAKSEQIESEPKKRAGRRRVASESVDVTKPSHEKEEPPKKKARGRHAATEEETKPEEVPVEKVEEVPAKKGRGEIQIIFKFERLKFINLICRN
jgi:hypothetical protein